MPINLSDFQAVMFDLDGTVCQEETVLPGVVDLGQKLTRIGVQYAILSNSTYSPRHVLERLRRMGFHLNVEQIYTAAAAACDHVLRTYGSGVGDASNRPAIFNLATEGVEELLDGKVSWVETSAKPCQAVVVGTPTNVYATDERQRLALDLLRGGADLIGICADRVFPSPRGVEFGSGALTSMLAYAANIQPIFCGKPEPAFFKLLCERLNLRAQDCVLIGDNLEADIGGGKAAGMKTVLTLTGVTTRKECESLPEALRPDWIIEDLRELVP